MTAATYDALDLLLEVMDLRRESVDSFTAASPDPTADRIFGGQVAAQATLAAAQTVPSGHRLVSLHCTYPRMGRPAQRIRFQVDRVADGRTFGFRRILAHQGDRLICAASASFHAGGEGPTHEWPRMTCPAPERLPAYEPRLPVMLTDAFELRRGLDPIGTPERGMDLAIRTVRRLPDDPLLHTALAVYVSDMFILDASLLAHQAEPVAFEHYDVATVDHTLQLHAPVRLDDWVIHRFESPSGGDGISEVRCVTSAPGGARLASGLQRAVLVRHREDRPGTVAR